MCSRNSNSVKFKLANSVQFMLKTLTKFATVFFMNVSLLS